MLVSGMVTQNQIFDLLFTERRPPQKSFSKDEQETFWKQYFINTQCNTQKYSRVYYCQIILVIDHEFKLIQANSLNEIYC